jgi:hypothetical protein
MDFGDLCVLEFYSKRTHITEVLICGLTDVLDM